MTSRLRMAALGAALLFAGPVHADSTFPDSLWHIRFGYIHDAFSLSSQNLGGVASTPTAIDLEYEKLSSPQSSTVFHLTWGSDLSGPWTLELIAAIGKRYYLFSSSYAGSSSEQGISLTLDPKWRFYSGFELGFGDVRVLQYSDFYQINSTVLRAGGNVGAIYQISGAIGAEAQAGASVGYGITALSVKDFGFSLLLGGVFYF